MQSSTSSELKVMMDVLESYRIFGGKFGRCEGARRTSWKRMWNVT